MDNNNISVLAIVTIIFACLTLLIKTCYKSKCSNIDLFHGLISIKRDVTIETDIQDSNKA